MPEEENEPQSVADASRAMANVGFDADTLVEGGTRPAPEPIVQPTSIADRQRAASEPGTAPVAPAAPAPSAPAATSPGTTQPVPAAVPQSPQELADQQAWDQWQSNEQAKRDAFNIQRGLTTEQGVRMIVAQGLTALKFNPADVQAFVEGRLTLDAVQQQQALAAAGVAPVAAPAPQANPWDNLTEEDLVDGVQAKEWFTKIRDDAVAAARAEVAAAQVPVQNAVRQEQQVRAGQVTDQTLVELLSDDGTPSTVDLELAASVLREANKYIDPNNWDSGHIRAAIIQGHYDVVKIAELAQRAYLNKKSLVAEGVPQTTGGAQAPGAEAAAEPKNTKEASKMAKAMFGW